MSWCKTNGTFNFRVLSSRQGVSEFTIKDNGQVHIFDVFAGRGYVDGEEEPDRPVESGGFRSSLSSGAATESMLLLQDNAIMTVNAENGIGISGPRGGADAGGTAFLIVRDSATFRVEQYLALGTGTQSETTNGTLEIRGPNASVFVGENLNMAVDTDGEIPTTDATHEDGSPVPGKSTLKAVITSDSHWHAGSGRYRTYRSGHSQSQPRWIYPQRRGIFYSDTRMARLKVNFVKPIFQRHPWLRGFPGKSTIQKMPSN